MNNNKEGMNREDIGAIALPLFDDLFVLTRGKTWEKQTPDPSQCEEFQGRSLLTTTTYSPNQRTKTDVEELKRKKASRKRENKRLQTIAEIIQKERDIERMTHYAYCCNASIRHLATFLTLLREGKETHKEIGLTMLKRRMNEKESYKMWSDIKRWLGGHTTNTGLAVAVTIGRKSNGWYVVRGVAIGQGAQSLLVQWWLYMTKRKQWKSKALSVAEDSKRLADYYSIECLENFLEELFEVFRASLMFDRRTYKNKRAIETLEKRTIPVAYNASYAVNGAVYGSPSSVALCECSIEDNRVLSADWVMNSSEENQKAREFIENEEF